MKRLEVKAAYCLPLSRPSFAAARACGQISTKMHRQMAPLAAPRKPLDGVSFCLGTTQHVESVVSNNRAMALETEGLELPQATITRGVEAVLSGAVPSAQYYLLARGQEVLAQLMITQEWSDWRASMIWWCVCWLRGDGACARACTC